MKNEPKRNRKNTLEGPSEEAKRFAEILRKLRENAATQKRITLREITKEVEIVRRERAKEAKRKALPTCQA